MIQSFVVYSLLAFMLYKLGSLCNANYNKNSSRYPFWNKEIILSISAFAFIAGARYNVGVDHLNYLQIYKDLGLKAWTSRETLESGFLYLTKLFVSINLHYFFYFAFWGALQIFFIYYACKKERFLLPWIGLIIVLGPYFLGWMNGIRQCVVECVFVFSIRYIRDRKIIIYILIIFLSSLIHKSVWMLLPLYFIPNKYLDISRYYYLALLLLCLYIGSSPYWLTVLQPLSIVLTKLGYEGYLNSFDTMLTTNLRETAFGPSRIGLLFINITIVYYYNEMRQFFKYSSLSLNLYFNLFFIGICFYELFVNTSHIFLRPIEYLLIFRLLMNAYLLVFLKKRNKKMFWIILFFSCSYIYIAVLKDYLSRDCLYVIYNFYFE